MVLILLLRPSKKSKLKKVEFEILERMPIICSYGSIIINSKDEKVLFERNIEFSLIKELIDFFQRTI